jgi:hypothetical protein
VEERAAFAVNSSGQRQRGRKRGRDVLCLWPRDTERLGERKPPSGVSVCVCVRVVCTGEDGSVKRRAEKVD